MIEFEKRKELLKEYFDSVEDENVKKFMGQCIETIPDYWFEVPASSSGKYHPTYALGNGGLMRHTIAMLRFFDRLVRNDIYGKPYTKKELDLLRVACLMHDSRKSGNQEEFEHSKWTKFEHPLLAAEVIRSIKTRYITNEEKELIATSIESHMGQWNEDKRSSTVLPTPKNKYQKLLHICDYLAATKGVEVQFDEAYNSQKQVIQENVTVDTYVFPFGKHKGMSLKEVNEKFPDYIEWFKKNADHEPLISLLKQL